MAKQCSSEKKIRIVLDNLHDGDSIAELCRRYRSLEPVNRAGRLIGLQHYPVKANDIAAADGNAKDAAEFFKAMIIGMGDACELETLPNHSVSWLNRSIGNGLCVPEV